MRRLALAGLLLAGAFLAPLVPACSSNGAASSSSDGGDGGIAPNQGAGKPCDPSLSNPCLQAPPCFTVACVEGPTGADTCVETQLAGPCESDAAVLLEASVPDSATVSSGCQSTYDCRAFDGDGSANYVCAFSAFDGCSSTGVCVIPEPPLKTDGGVETACGCDGQPVQYVTSILTDAPAQSPSPCAATVVDSGTDAADAGADSGAPDAGSDAAEDAPSDAPADG